MGNMIQKTVRFSRRLRGAIELVHQIDRTNRIVAEEQKLLLGRMLANQVKSADKLTNLADVEFKVFSQFGDDGIIQWLNANIEIPHKTFIEFGVEDYRESNTRFLMMNDNWSGFVMDGSPENVSHILSSEYYWKYDLIAKAAFIDRNNINELIASRGFEKEVGLLHIDLDGNDYWIWQIIDVIDPIIVIAEYNSVFGIDRAITVPYDDSFYRTKAHPSNLYFGASLKALHGLGVEKGYAFVGCNSAGNNAYFVRRDKLNERIKEVSLEDGFVTSKYRESRNEAGELTYAAGGGRKEIIRGMPVHNVMTGLAEEF